VTDRRARAKRPHSIGVLKPRRASIITVSRQNRLARRVLRDAARTARGLSLEVSGMSLALSGVECECEPLAEEADVKVLKVLAAAAMTLLASGCAYGLKVSTDYDASADLARYRTFFVLHGNSSGNPAADLKIGSGVETALTNKGWSEVPRDEAEAVIVINSATSASHSYSSFYGAWGGQWHRGGASRPILEDYKPGALVVDIFDAGTTQPVWHGSVDDVVSHTPSPNAHVSKEAINKLFQPLPDPPPLIDVRSAMAQPAEPRIIFSESPAVLVLIDGAPIYRNVPGTELQQVVNTKALILRDGAGVHYLRIFGRWMEAYTLRGPWTVSGVGPDDAAAALAEDGNSSRDLYARQATEAEAMPTVYVSPSPADLVVTDGAPQLAPVAGTPLLYVRNTTDHIFKEPTDQEFYVLASGHWYRAWTTNGPWQPAPDSQLPADFANIHVDALGSSVHQ
jgi:Domain of unknown function (DUF4136)